MEKSSVALGIAAGEAHMSLKVFKKDGTVEEHQGHVVVQISEELEAAIRRYKVLVKEIKELETFIISATQPGE